MSSRKIKAALGLSTVMTAILVASTAQAQVETGETTREEDIIVTAQRRGEERLIDTPLAITAVTGAEIEARDGALVSQFLREAPGVSLFQLDEGRSLIQIRGVGATFGDAPVGYYLDDLPFSLISRAWVPDANPFDLNRVEILRGPQGTLYGASSQGGTVRILTNDANPSGEFSGRVSGSYGATEGAEENSSIQAVLNLPLVEDRLAIRLVGGTRDLSGYLDNPIFGQSNINDTHIDTWRGKLTFDVTNNLSIRASVWDESSEGGSQVFANDNYERLVAIPAEYVRTDFTLYNVAVEYSFPNVDFYSTTSHIDYYYDSNADFRARDFFLTVDYLGFNQEFRLASTYDSNLQWTAGLFFQDGEDRQCANLVALASSGCSTFTSTQWAMFGELHYFLLDDRLEATLGARHFEDEREIDDTGNASRATLTALGLPLIRAADYTHVSPRFNLAYRFGQDQMAYFNAANGFRSGILQLGTSIVFGRLFGANPPVTLESEDVWSYEVGTKLAFANNDLVFQGALYYLDYQNIMVGITTPAGILYFDNVAAATGTGIELGLTYQGIDGLTLEVAGNYNNTEYEEDLPGIVRISAGDAVAQVPRYNISASAQYEWPLSNTGLTGTLRANLTHVAPLSFYSTAGLNEGDPNTLLGLRIGVRGDGWALLLSGENLLNEDGKIATVGTVLGGQLAWSRARPRTLGINVQLDF